LSWKEAQALAELWASAADAARVGRGVTPDQLEDFSDSLRLWVKQQPDGESRFYIYISMRVKEALEGFAATCEMNSQDLDPTNPDPTKPDAPVLP